MLLQCLSQPCLCEAPSACDRGGGVMPHQAVARCPDFVRGLFRLVRTGRSCMGRISLGSGSFDFLSGDLTEKIGHR